MLPLLIAATFAGCSGGSKVACYPVRGSIQFKEPPGHQVLMIFNPVAGRAAVPSIPTAEVAADGSFVASTYGNGDGAPAGQYHLTLVVPSEEREALPNAAASLQQKHSEPSRPIATVVIKEGANDIPTIKLR